MIHGVVLLATVEVVQLPKPRFSFGRWFFVLCQSSISSQHPLGGCTPVEPCSVSVRFKSLRQEKAGHKLLFIGRGRHSLGHEGLLVVPLGPNLIYSPLPKTSLECMKNRANLHLLIENKKTTVEATTVTTAPSNFVKGRGGRGARQQQRVPIAGGHGGRAARWGGGCVGAGGVCRRNDGVLKGEAKALRWEQNRRRPRREWHGGHQAVGK